VIFMSGEGVELLACLSSVGVFEPGFCYSAVNRSEPSEQSGSTVSGLPGWS